MNSICLYSSFFHGDTIPYYVRFYLEQLRPYFTRIIYIHNEKILSEESNSFLNEKGVESMMVKNEGYDFGMWYKALQSNDLKGYDRIALVNDSCILFKDLNVDFKNIENANAEYSGMVISDRYATHMQSFFLVISGKAIPVLLKYFETHGIVNDYRQVIQTYEIGLTQEMIRKGMRVYSLYNTKNRSYEKNPSFALVKELIEEGMPMIKKKIVFRNFRGLEYYWIVRMNFDVDYRKYIKQIRAKYKTGLIDFDLVMADAPHKGHSDILLFSFARAIANFLRRIPGMRWLFHKMVDVYKKYFRKA